MYVKDKLIHRIHIIYVLFWDEVIVMMVALDKQMFIWKQHCQISDVF